LVVPPGEVFPVPPEEAPAPDDARAVSGPTSVDASEPAIPEATTPEPPGDAEPTSVIEAGALPASVDPSDGDEVSDPAGNWVPWVLEPTVDPAASDGPEAVGVPEGVGPGDSEDSEDSAVAAPQSRALGALAVLIALAGLLVAAVSFFEGGAGPAPATGANQPARRGAAASAAGASAAPGAAPAPVALVEPDGSGGSAMVAVLVPAGRGGSVFLVPPGAMEPIGSFGLQPIGDALRLGGTDRVTVSLENLLGIQVGSTVVADPATLQGLVAPSGTLNVDLPGPVEQTDSSGQVVVSFGSGPARVAPSQVPALLSSVSDGGDISRLARQAAFFDAWVTAVGHNPSAAPPPSSPVAPVLTALGRGPLHEQLVPVQSIGQDDSGRPLYQVQTTTLAAMVKAAVGGSSPLLLAGAGPDRPTVEVLNGTGHLEVAASAADHLVPAGFRVSMIGNAGSSGFAATQIVYYRPADRAAATKVASALGVGQLVFDDHPLGVVEISVIVGKDYRAHT